MKTSIDIFIDRKVVVLKENNRVLEAAKAMCEGGVGCVVVANGKSKITGILTDRDIVCNLISEELDSETPLKKIMETDVAWLSDKATVDDVVALMKDQGIRRVPIVELSPKGHTRCVGLVTLDDLIAGEFITTKDLSDIVKAQIFRKKQALHRRKHKDSRLDQTYSKFIAQMSRGIGLQKDKTEDLTKFILGTIVQRLHYSGGVQFISQFPKRLQEALLDIPAGPDRSITDKTIVQGISIRTKYDLKTSKILAQKFWNSLDKIIGFGETEHVIHQLPGAMKELFTEASDVETSNFGGQKISKETLAERL